MIALKLQIAPPPCTGIGEVTVKIKAVALNHIDVWGWRGMAFAKRKMPLVIGAGSFGRRGCCRPQRFQSPARSARLDLWRAHLRTLPRLPQKVVTICAEHVGGVHGFHLDGFACEAVNLPARLLGSAPPVWTP